MELLVFTKEMFEEQNIVKKYDCMFVSYVYEII